MATVTPIEKGRMIASLRRDARVKTAVNGWTGTRRVVGRTRRFTDEQIASALGLTKAEMKKFVDVYEATMPKWTDEDIVHGVVRFAKTEKRWPSEKDFRETDYLPSPWTYRRHGGDDLLLFTLTSDRVKQIPAAAILGIRNVTVRQEAIEAYGGIELLVKDGGAVLVQEDDFGKLWRVPDGASAEPWAYYVEVENATEVGGERDHYFLRVPPTVRTAKRAVEWTFNINAGQLEEFAAAT